MAKPRLRGTAFAKRRYEVAQMNLAGMTLGGPGSKRTAHLADSVARRSVSANHDAERRATYWWEKCETQSGKPSFPEGVLKCIDKRWDLLELGRKKGV